MGRTTVRHKIGFARTTRHGRAGTRIRDLDATSVAELVDRARAGDEDAFGLLYLEFRRRIHTLARFHLDAGAADDAVAETFTRAWAALPRYRDTGAPFVAWLYGIARHVVADAARVAARVQPLSDPDSGSLDHRSREDDRLLIGDVLAQLPPEQRAVIELKFFAGLSNEEVAVALGKSPGAINTQQWRALGALRALVGER